MKFALRRVVSDNNNGKYVGIEEPADYNKFSNEKYIELYNYCVDSGILKADSFNSEKWYFVDQNLSESTICFDIIQFSLELKRYAIVMLRYTTNQPSTIAKEVRSMIWGLQESAFLSASGEEELREKIMFYNVYQVRKIMSLIRLINFLGHEEHSEYINMLKKLNSKESARLLRSLPDYDSLLKYDAFIDDFHKNGPIELKKVYFPIVIWWKFTSIIPMRPLEIAELPNNCIFEENGEYYIKLVRVKEKRSIVDDYRTNEDLRAIAEKKGHRKTQVLKISKEIFDLLYEYQDNYRSKLIDDYFFEIKFKQINRRGALSDLLKEFNSEVIGNYYGVSTLSVAEDKTSNNEIKLPRLGDTRHLAFCSMMLQGFNPHTIMEIGGHEVLESQLHYTSHMETFSQSSIKQISEVMINLIIKGDSTAITAGFSRKNFGKLVQLGDELFNLPKVHGGRCTSRNVPYTCPPTECVYCEEYFIFENDKDFINILQKNKQREIKVKLDYMKALYGNVKKKLVEEIDCNEKLRSSANELNTLVKQKSILDVYERI